MIPNCHHRRLVGCPVIYVAKNGHKHRAMITAIPENPGHAYTDKPTVTLEFRDAEHRLRRIARALPWSSAHGFTTGVWQAAS